MPSIIQLLDRGSYQIQKEAAWAVSNVTFCGKSEHVLRMIDYGVIPPLCSLFKVEDTVIVLTVLEAVFNILRIANGHLDDVCHKIEECGGLDKIEELEVGYIVMSLL
jgi:hypothetical protein